jgi:hypothetical protein
LPGKYSGLHLLCLQYVAFQQIKSEQDIGFNLPKEYGSVLALFGKNNNNGTPNRFNWLGAFLTNNLDEISRYEIKSVRFL